jgi:hypothetical protein
MGGGQVGAGLKPAPTPPALPSNIQPHHFRNARHHFSGSQRLDAVVLAAQGLAQFRQPVARRAGKRSASRLWHYSISRIIPSPRW